MLHKPVTLTDIARAAGVSKATAARAISLKGYVADDARKRINEAAGRLGYRPNLVARGFRSRRTFSIGHIAHAITENPFFAHVARAVEREAIANGYKVFLYNQDGTDEHEKIGVEQFIERRVDAIVFTYARSAQNLSLLREAGMPVVQIERERTGDTHAVLVDNVAGAESAMRHLLQLGHRRIAYIGGDPRLYPRSFSRGRSVEEERLGAYVQSLRNTGVSLDTRLIQLDDYVVIGSDGANVTGYRRMRALLDLPERPTAIFVGCDLMAAGALQAIYEARLRVPDDISVVGYDDTLAASLTPRLTTVAQPMAELGFNAIRFVLSTIGDPDFAPQTTTLSPKLIIRQSTASPP